MTLRQGAQKTQQLLIGIIDTPEIARRIGVMQKGGTLAPVRGKTLLTPAVRELASRIGVKGDKRIDTRRANKVEQRHAILDAFPPSAKVAKKKAEPKPAPLTPQSPAPTPPVAKPPAPKPQNPLGRIHVFVGDEFQPKNRRCQAIYSELCALHVERFVNACAFSLRAILEMSVDEFAKKHSVDVRKPSGEKHALGERLKRVSEELKKKDPKVELGQMAKLNHGKAGVITHLHEFIHNSIYYPDRKDLIRFSDALKPFLTALWDHFDR